MGFGLPEPMNPLGNVRILYNNVQYGQVRTRSNKCWLEKSSLVNILLIHKKEDGYEEEKEKVFR
jgi:hypothetical protein